MFSGIFYLLENILFFTGYVDTSNYFEKPLSNDEESKLLQRIEKGDSKAKNELAKHNLRLVVHIVKKYASYDDNDELISVGNVGLSKAINTYKLSKGTKFSTYAARCIENEVLMCIRANKRFKDVKSIYDPIYLDDDGNDSTLLDVIGDDENTIFNLIENEQLKDSLNVIMQKVLTNQEYEIISLRYGLNDKTTNTQKQVARKFGISRSYVSRIETKALTKIKQHIIDKNLLSELF